VIGEEFGFAGIATVVGLFAWLVWRAFHIGRESRKLERHFQALAAQAIGIWIGWQCFINIGVNLGLLPTKGLTLPAFDQEFYKERLAFYAGHAIETLTEKIWARMEEQRTCTNGGFKLWGCPYGCARHLVPVDDD
jgi:hypothetical protein